LCSQKARGFFCVERGHPARNERVAFEQVLD
jgi:hypothetical protein